jgi:Holliday junction DNA helicase RuvB
VLFRFNGGPVGLHSLAVSVGEEPDTIEEVYEPFLIQQGLLKRTPQGRVATKQCFDRFGVTPTGGQGSLF